MQRCPKCGYRERIDWPGILGVLAFGLLYVVWMLGNYSPRELRGLGLAAMVLFVIASIWKVLRIKACRSSVESNPVQRPANSH